MDLSIKKIAPLSPSLKDAIAFNEMHYTPAVAVCQSLFRKFFKKSKIGKKSGSGLDKRALVCYNCKKMSKGVHFCGSYLHAKTGAFPFFIFGKET